MCSRYYIDEEMAEEIDKIILLVEEKLRTERRPGNVWKSGEVRSVREILNPGDVHPSQNAPVLTAGSGNTGLRAESMPWGFLQYQRKGLLINARAETALERPMFRDSVRQRRCVIPAKYFYEWDADKNKVTFSRKGQPVLYMAGFYNDFQGTNRFIILTTQANDSVKPVHERMPLLLEENELQGWMLDDRFMEYVLQKTPHLLEKRQEYEQQSLFEMYEDKLL